MSAGRNGMGISSIRYAVPGALPEKYAAMVPEGWGQPVADNSVDERSAAVGEHEMKNYAD